MKSIYLESSVVSYMVTDAVSDFGLVCPVLCSPEELMGEDDA